MCLPQVRTQALNYLHIHPEAVDEATNALLERCFALVQDKAHPHFITKIYPLSQSPLSIEGISLDYPELVSLFSSCHSVCVIGATLGIEVDRYSRLLSKTDLSTMVVFDAVASSYLEVQCDQYEQSLSLGRRTFRYCPGYGAVPLTLNRNLCRALQMDKHIGLTVQPSLLLLPQKSMIGLIGLGATGSQKSCKGCPNFDHCVYRKKEQPCYIQSNNN